MEISYTPHKRTSWKVGTNMASHVFRTKDGIYFPRLLQGFMKGEVEQLVLRYKETKASKKRRKN